MSIARPLMQAGGLFAGGVLALGLTFAGQLAQAQAVDPAVKEKLLAAIVKNGCQVNENNNEAILTEAGVEPGAAKVIVEALVADGSAVVDDGALLLKTEGCN